jgi:hypothetical protein
MLIQLALLASLQLLVIFLAMYAHLISIRSPLLASPTLQTVKQLPKLLKRRRRFL